LAPPAAKGRPDWHSRFQNYENEFSFHHRLKLSHSARLLKPLLGVGTGYFLPDPLAVSQRKACSHRRPEPQHRDRGHPAGSAGFAGPQSSYENFAAPGVLVRTATTEAGQQVHSVEWMGRNGGEPSIGSELLPLAPPLFKSGAGGLFVNFDSNSCPVSGATATMGQPGGSDFRWFGRRPDLVHRPQLLTDALGFHSHTFGGRVDFPDPGYGQSFLYTDDDGMTWFPDRNGGLASAVDHTKKF